MRPEIFLYQAGAPPIVLGELPVTPVLPAEEYAQFDELELIEGGAPFNHRIPEVVIAPCWVQDWSIAPLDRQMIAVDDIPTPVIPPPVVYRDSEFRDDAFPERPVFHDSWLPNPATAAMVIVPEWKLDWISDQPLPPLDRELISDIGYVPLRDVPIVPLGWFVGAGEIEPRVLELLGAEVQTPVISAPPQFMDWLVQHPDLPLEVRERLDAVLAAPPSPVHVPDIHGWYEGLSREAVGRMRELIGENFQTLISIAAESVVVKVCSVTVTPAIAASDVDSTPAIAITGADSTPAIRLDSADSDLVC